MVVGDVVEFPGATVAVEAPVVRRDPLTSHREHVAVRACRWCTRADGGSLLPDVTAPATYGVLSPPDIPSDATRLIVAGMRGEGKGLRTVLCGGSGGDRPDHHQATLCGPHVQLLARAAGLDKWVLVGQQAVDLWQRYCYVDRGLTVMEALTHIGVWPGVGYVMVVPETWRDDDRGRTRKKLVAMLRQFDAMESPLDWVGGDGRGDGAACGCVRCGGQTWKMGRDGMTWCKGCWDE